MREGEGDASRHKVMTGGSMRKAETEPKVQPGLFSPQRRSTSAPGL